MYVVLDQKKGIRRRLVFSGARWKDNWQWARIEIQINSLKHKKQLFYYGSSQTLEQVATRSCGVSIHEDIQNLTGHSPEQSALADPVWAEALDETVSRDAFQPQLFCDSVILWYELKQEAIVSSRLCHSFIQSMQYKPRTGICFDWKRYIFKFAETFAKWTNLYSYNEEIDNVNNDISPETSTISAI